MAIRSTYYAVFLATSLLLVSCGTAPYECNDPLGCLEIPPGSPVVIGALLATSGPQRSLGDACMDSIAAVIKDQPDVLGHAILLERHTTDGTPEDARAEATDMATDPNLLAVVGPSLSAESLVAAPIFAEAGIVSLTPVLDPPMAKTMAEEVIAAIAQVATQAPDKTLFIPRQALLKALNPPP